MHTVSTQIEIDTTMDKVWDALADFEKYPSWNPFVTEITGELTLNSRLKVRLSQPQSKPMTVSPTVVKLVEGRTFGWKGRLGIPGIFDGEHSFELEDLGGGRTRLKHFENFTGLLVPVMKKMLDDKTRRGFESMNSALKERVEGAH